MVVVNDTGSEFFEQAIFIVKPGGSAKLSEVDMAAEAQRIVDGYVRRYYATQSGVTHVSIKSRKKTFMKKKTVFWLGMAGAAAATTITGFLIGFPF